MAKAKFVLRKGTTGKFRFYLIGSNGKVMATSATYDSRASALRGIDVVRRHTRSAELVDQTGSRVVGSARKKTTRRPKTLAASDAGAVTPGDISVGDLTRPRVVA